MPLFVILLFDRTLRSIETNLLFTMHKQGLDTAIALDDGNDIMLEAAAVQVETARDDEDFTDGDDVHLAAAGTPADNMLATASIKFENDEDFNDGDDVHLDAARIMAEISYDNISSSSSGDDSSDQGEEENLFEESG